MKKFGTMFLFLLMGQCATMGQGGKGTAMDKWLGHGLMYTPNYHQTQTVQPAPSQYQQAPPPRYNTVPSYADTVDASHFGGN